MNPRALSFMQAFRRLRRCAEHAWGNSLRAGIRSSAEPHH